MLEYETFFGGPNPETAIKINIREEDGEKSILVEVPDTDDQSPFLMYYSLQAYFANGGGPCYIISVGIYEEADPVAQVTHGALNIGLEQLEKEDEPTLIIFPDATRLPDPSDCYSLYNNALALCRKMRDRFTIIDTFTNHMATEIGAPAGVRESITSDLELRKYGAVYFPYIETILNYSYDPEEIIVNHHVIDSSPVTEILEEIDDILSEADGILAGFPTLITAFTDADTAIQSESDEGALANRDTLTEPLEAVVNALREYQELMQETVENANNVAAMAVDDTELAEAATDAAAALTAEIETSSDLDDLISDLSTQMTAITDAADGADVKTASEAVSNRITDAGITTMLQNLMDLVDPVIIDALLEIEGLDMQSDGELNDMMLADIEEVDSATFNKIRASINKLRVVLPPSSAVAGVYARVDGNRGVWFAPANVSLNYVIKPTVKITNDMQDRLNVDTTSGKSINAIRTFTGKGTLVWGARTLAGNDNEWRYVSVRRFFNMVEESVKKATEQFVFEPNDANTWVKVRAMIENFLILQWRAGALAGAKPEHAFYVRVGLGQTMTAMDILEGKMNIEIGMAVVRPAEFIILKFSHKMQES